MTVQNCIHEEIKDRFDLLLRAEYFVFQFVIQKYKDLNVQKETFLQYVSVKLGLSYWGKNMG